ncbi:DNA-directed RNA polymerase [Nowakowskiella sp. JEL0078]|nr:DNA-directed RNA polymerase [Nowakowskiella sp. JEL0078]
MCIARVKDLTNPTVSLIKSPEIADSPSFKDFDPELETIIPDLFPQTAKQKQEILADYNLRKLGHELRSVNESVLREKFSLIYAYIHTFEMSKAEVLFHRLIISNPEEVRYLMTTEFINSFLEGFLECEENLVRIERASDWFDRFEQYGLTPDETSFSIMISYFISKSDTKNVEIYLMNMRKYNILPEDILSNGRFIDPEDRAPLLAIMKKIGMEIGTSSTSSEELLLSVLEESAVLPESSISRDFLDKEYDDDEELLKEIEKIEIDSTDSLGVSLIRKTLLNMKSKSFEDRKNMQVWLEEEAYSMALRGNEQERTLMPEDVFALSQFPTELLIKWHKALVPLIKREIDVLEGTGPDSPEADLLPFLKLLKPEQLSLITITEFVKSPHKQELQLGLPTGEHRLIKLIFEIGKNIETEHALQETRKKKNRKSLHKKDQAHLLHIQGKLFSGQARRLVASLSRKELDGNATWKPSWSPTTIVKIGALLATLMVKSATVKVRYMDSDKNDQGTVEEPAFWHAKRRIKIDLVYGVIQSNPAVRELISQHIRLNMDIKMLPMLTPPRPWLTWKSGGYLVHEEKAVRCTGNRGMKRLVAEASKAGKLDDVFKVLDFLGILPWRVNSKVLRVVLDCWNSGIAIGKLPTRDAPDMDEMPDFTDDEKGRNEKKQWEWQQKKKMDELKNLYSLRCSANYLVEIARSFVGNTIYFPHNLDFRGRAYPIPSYFSHIGNDLSRGLLLFDEAKPLGERGFFWLKVHLSNLAGNDKVSLDDRVKWTEKHLNEIHDSADNPMSFLSACFELTSAIRSPDPFSFRSRLHVHQDGSCNGLQHYAALGGDVAGAEQVNLVPSSKPADIYSGVASLVSEKIHQEAIEGNEIAKLIDGKINRKIVKQTVMTITYGVTFIGARDQVYNRLKDLKEEIALSENERKLCAAYISRKIFLSIGDLFKASRLIQKWLNDSARLISLSSHESQIDVDELKIAKKLMEIGAIKDGSIELAIEDAEVKTENEKNENLLDSLPINQDKPEKLEDLEDELEPNSYADMLRLVLSEDSNNERENEFSQLKTNDTKIKNPEITFSPTSPRNIFLADDVPMRNHSVTWTSPLNLPISQPYREFKKKIVQTFLQLVSVIDDKTPAAVQPRKQSTAFPPNFIHSLDAAHMMLTAIECQKANISFASVHDSFWTHACDVDTLSSLLRDTFVKLHSAKIMERLKKEFEIRYSAHKIPVKIEISGNKLLKYNEFLAELSSEKEKLKESFTIGDLAKEMLKDGLKSNKKVSQKPVVKFAKKSYTASNLLNAFDKSNIVLGKDSDKSASHQISSTVDKLYAKQEEKEFLGDLRNSETDTFLKKSTSQKKKIITTWVDLKFAELPPNGTLDINCVKNSTYFFH